MYTSVDCVSPPDLLNVDFFHKRSGKQLQNHVMMHRYGIKYKNRLAKQNVVHHRSCHVQGAKEMSCVRALQAMLPVVPQFCNLLSWAWTELEILQGLMEKWD